ncbi:MAG TPA: uroporphyrinogen decarboxylase [Bryobacteraceae bacterium]|nr:uroporphyrinogen decarboxylase [Bryobacteraceae bacterium]
MNGRFLEACRRRPTDVRPVWFMRQAGRYMKQYRDLRSKHGILEICKRPDLAAQVTLQPVEILDVDAAIIFADLLLPVEPMGLKLSFAAGEGPVIANPVRTANDVDSLSISNTDDLGYVGESIQLVAKALAGRVPVIGFVGAPFTMASYMIEGGPSRNFLRTKQMMYRDETLWRRLMGKLVDVLGSFAVLQVAAGARIIQVFDSWVGALGPDDYVRFVAPYSRALIERIRSASVPVIHFGTGASGFFRELHAAGGDVMGVDWRVSIDQAWMDISYRSAVQGNLDPAILFAPLPELRTRIHELLKRTGSRPGHIFNLGHGILPETPVENVKACVEIVREFRL